MTPTEKTSTQTTSTETTPTAPQKARDLALLERTLVLAAKARADGNHPFGALLADQQGKILIESGNAHAQMGGTGHAELLVAQKASERYSPQLLATTTLYTSVEPCAMCAGALYWAGIGTLVFGLTEKRLAVLTGDNEENLTMDLPCRTVFTAGQRPVAVRGPFAELEDQIAAGHKNFW